MSEEEPKPKIEVDFKKVEIERGRKTEIPTKIKIGEKTYDVEIYAKIKADGKIYWLKVEPFQVIDAWEFAL